MKSTLQTSGGYFFGDSCSSPDCDAGETNAVVARALVVDCDGGSINGSVLDNGGNGTPLVGASVVLKVPDGTVVATES